MRRNLILLALGLASTLPASGRESSPSAPLQFNGIPSPAVGASAQPNMSVSGRGVLLSWVERHGPAATLKFAERTGTGWTAPRTVASGTNWFVNWADVPSVMRLTGRSVVGHWLQRSGPGTYAYDVRLARSTDGGRTFSASFLPHHDGTKTEHGFVSFYPAGQGFGLVWLDGREMRGAGASPGAMTLRHGVFDAKGAQASEVVVDDRVCECCPTTIATTSEGPVVAYRNRSEDEIRDIYVSRFENGTWTAGQPVARDNWNITGCPVNGPMLSARGRDVALAWFTGKEGQNRAFVAFSRDAGRSFGAPVRVDDVSTLGRVDLELLAGGGALVSWIEHVDRVATFRVRTIRQDGVRSSAVTVAQVTADRTSGYPRIALHNDEIVAAWVESQKTSSGAPELRVRTAVARVPRG